MSKNAKLKACLKELRAVCDRQIEQLKTINESLRRELTAAYAQCREADARGDYWRDKTSELVRTLKLNMKYMETTLRENKDLILALKNEFEDGLTRERYTDG